uniref:Uncharacterized protein n=1 Tax=Anopheles maculatus TaxID=74869 RepID=A0A182SQT6_9DIPT
TIVTIELPWNPIINNGAQSPAAACTAPSALSPQQAVTSVGSIVNSSEQQLPVFRLQTVPVSQASTSSLRTINGTTTIVLTGSGTVPAADTNDRSSLKCLETLAEKAGITFDEPYDFLPDTLEKSQSPAQVAQQATVPLQLSQEQLFQYQQIQAYGGTIQQLYGAQPIVFPPLGGQQQFQLITASKPFQGTPQMLTTTTGKQVIGTTGAGNFNGPFTFFSPMSVVNSQPQAQAQNLLPALSATAAAQSAVATGAAGNKAGTTHQQDMQKALQNAVAAASVATPGQKVALQKLGTAGTAQQQNLAALTQQQAAAAAGQQCVQVSQAPMQTAQLLSPLQQQGPQQMQFSTQWPLQGQIWSTANGLLASNPIIIRGTNPDGTPNVFFPSTQQTL